MTVPFIQELVQTGLQLDADRYRALRQKFKNHEVSLELWGEYYKNQAAVNGPDELDDYLDRAIEVSNQKGAIMSHEVETTLEDQLIKTLKDMLYRDGNRWCMGIVGDSDVTSMLTKGVLEALETAAERKGKL